MTLQEILRLQDAPETKEEREQIDACLAETGGDGRRALLNLIRRIEALTTHQELLGQIRSRVFGVAS